VFKAVVGDRHLFTYYQYSVKREVIHSIRGRRENKVRKVYTHYNDVTSTAVFYRLAIYSYYTK